MHILKSVLDSSNTWLTVTGIMIFILILDGTVTKYPAYDLRAQMSRDTAIFFAIIVIVSAISQLFYLMIIGKRYNEDSKVKNQRNYVRMTHRIVTVIQCIIITCTIVLVAEVAFFKVYDTFALRIAYLMSIGLAISLGAFLAFQLFKWTKKRQDYLLFAYALASTMIAVNSILIGSFVTLEIQEEPGIIKSTRMSISLANLGYFDLKQFQINFSSLSFLSLWLASTLLLRLSGKSIGVLKFYFIISLPLLYYFGIFELVTSYFFEHTKLLSQFQIYTFSIVNSSLTRPIGGFLFGIAFWTIARSVKAKNIGNYIRLSAFGMILLSISTQDAELYNLPYPPFGISTLSFVGIASYLLFIGIYYSALTVSIDHHIRSTIHKSVEKQLQFVSKIGNSKMEDDIRRKVANATGRVTEYLETESGIESTMGKEEIDQYIRIALEETKKLSKEEKNGL